MFWLHHPRFLIPVAQVKTCAGHVLDVYLTTEGKVSGGRYNAASADRGCDSRLFLALVR
jgi:hypothetical protein